jgi:phage gpG-like protein
MLGEFSIRSFIAYAAVMDVLVEEAKHHALETTAKHIEKKAKEVIGTYDYGWPQLAESTQEDRVHKGFSANDPLLRTGQLRDSIGHTVDGSTRATVGSNEDVAVYQELGTATIPPRSFLLSTAMHEHDKILHIIGETVVKSMIEGQVLKTLLFK